MNPFSRSPLLLYSYLATEMLAPFLASFLVMNGVFLLVKLIPFLDFALELGIGFADFTRLFSYLMPNMLLYTVPMAAMMGIIICFSRLSSDSEILALKAGGISIYQFLPPVIAVAGGIALATSYVSVELIAKSQIAMRQLTYQLLKEKIDKGIKENQFTEALGDLVVHVGEIDSATGEWKNVWVSDMRGQANPAITMASTGKMVSDIREMNVTILLRNGSLHRPEGRSAQIVRFDRYVINIPLQLPAQAKTKERSIMSQLQLLAGAKHYGLADEQGRSMLVEFHKRLVLPVGCLIMSVLGLPLGLLAGPGKKTIGIPLGLTVFIAYYLIFTGTRTAAEEGLAPIALLMWAPNTLFLLLAFIGIHRVTHELPILPERLQAIFAAINQATRPWRRQIASSASRLRSKILASRLVTSHASSPVMTVPVTANPEANLYHLPGCRFHDAADSTVKFDSPQEAEDAGFDRCSACAVPRHNRDTAASR